MAARYHPGVIWGPFLLALALGLAVSAGLYFAYLWPQVEPDDEALDATAAAGSAAAPPTESAPDANPDDQAKVDAPETAQAGNNSSDEAPSTESPAGESEPTSGSSPA